MVKMENQKTEEEKPAKNVEGALASDAKSEAMSNVISILPHLESVGDDFRFEADDILEAAKGGLKNVVIIGEDEDDELFVAASMNAGIALILLERAKRRIVFGDE